MKRLLALSFSVVLTVPAFAGTRLAPGAEAEVTYLPPEPGRFARRLAPLRAARSGVGASVVMDARSSDNLIFPAAGSVRGAGGELFRSDVTLVSYDPDENQRVSVTWLQNGVATDDPPEVVLTLEPNTYYVFTDFVGQTLKQQNQLGTIVVTPIDAAGKPDLFASIDGFSRIWTNQPNAAGTVSQRFEAVDPFKLAAARTAAIMGLRHDAQYRSNFGIVNLSGEPQTFDVRFLGETATNTLTVTLAPRSMIHRGVPAGNYGPLVIEVDVHDEKAFWVAYGTSNDNVSGDGWVSLGSLVVLANEELGKE